MNGKIHYNQDMDADEQIDMEEMIAALIFDHPEVSATEEAANELGREILYRILRQFCPEFFQDWEV